MPVENTDGQECHPTPQHVEQIAFLLDFGAIVSDQRSSNQWSTSLLYPNLQIKFQVRKNAQTSRLWDSQLSGILDTFWMES